LTWYGRIAAFTGKTDSTEATEYIASIYSPAKRLFGHDFQFSSDSSLFSLYPNYMQRFILDGRILQAIPISFGDDEESSQSVEKI